VFLDNGNVSLHDDRWYTKPWGVNGGGVGTRSTKTLVRHSISQLCPPCQVLQSKEDFVQVRSLKCIYDVDLTIPQVNAGDVLEWVTWGGE